MFNIKLMEDLRQEHHYTQEQMAKMLGYESRTAYNYKLKGKREFTVEDVIAICNIFDVTPNQLIIIEKAGK